MAHARIVAVGLLTESDLDRLGHTFTRAWPVQNIPCFEDLLEAIDGADQDLKNQGPVSSRDDIP